MMLASSRDRRLIPARRYPLREHTEAAGHLARAVGRGAAALGRLEARDALEDGVVLLLRRVELAARRLERLLELLHLRR